jgi:DNA-binding transcriptional MerR regulator
MVDPERDRGESITRRPAAGGRPAKSAAAFRTISEVADELDVAQHVLRFWESKFPQVRPLKRGGGRRYYRPEDVDLLRQIRSLLYEEGYTIRGAQKLLKGQRRPSHDSDNGSIGASVGAGREVASRAGPGPGAELRRVHAAEPAAGSGAQAAPELPLERRELAPETRERLLDLRAELVALRAVLRDVTG